MDVIARAVTALLLCLLVSAALLTSNPPAREAFGQTQDTPAVTPSPTPVQPAPASDSPSEGLDTAVLVLIGAGAVVARGVGAFAVWRGTRA